MIHNRTIEDRRCVNRVYVNFDRDLSNAQIWAEMDQRFYDSTTAATNLFHLFLRGVSVAWTRSSRIIYITGRDRIRAIR
jgi:hypothetical protein